MRTDDHHALQGTGYQPEYGKVECHETAGPPVLSAREVGKEIAFGSFAGMVAEVFEYPFDLAKVRLQAQLLSTTTNTHTRYRGPLHCLIHTWDTEGLRGLYRGLPAPIVGSMAETAALFLSYSAFQNVIRTYVAKKQPDISQPLTLPQLGLAAAGAGFVTSFILTPIELVKCKLQVQMMSRNAHTYPHTQPQIIPSKMATSIRHKLFFSPNSHSSSQSTALKSISTARYVTHEVLPIKSPPGINAIITQTLRTHGWRGLWIGHYGTILRETGGSAAWFVSKEWVAQLLLARRPQKHSHNEEVTHIDDITLKPWESVLAGAVAGAVGVLVLYPADTIKSVMQTEEELCKPALSATAKQPTKPRLSTFLGTWARMYRSHGVRGLYAGCGMTVARAVPSSGIIFLVYDGLTAWWR